MTGRFLHEEDGAVAIEYGLIAVLVSVAIIGSLELLGVSIDGLFEWVRERIVPAITA